MFQGIVGRLKSGYFSVIKYIWINNVDATCIVRVMTYSKAIL